MALAKQQQSAASLARDMRHRVLTCLGKLADRDTHSAAAAELESIARALTHNSIPPFLSFIAATDATDKSPVRKQCVRLISLLSEAHGDTLSPYLSKLLSAVVRRLRDPDSAVRAACVSAISSISSHIVKPPFSSIIKPLIDALVTEQDQNSQIGAALCLAAAIDASPDPEPLYLKKLLPRLEKLLKCESFKAKPALLALVGSVVGTGAASSQLMLKNLVPCLVEFIGSEDWAARKAAAETLVLLASVQSDMLVEFKDSALKKFEARRYDKVKAVRETMNQLVEVWKEIPDVLDEASPLAEPQSSSKDNASDGRRPLGSKTSCAVTSGASQLGRISAVPNRPDLPDGSVVTTTSKRNSVDATDKKSGAAMFRKLERKRPSDCKAEIAAPHAPSTTIGREDDPMGRDEIGSEKGAKMQSRVAKPEVKQALFNRNTNDEKMLKLGAAKAGTSVVPCHDEIAESPVVVSNNSDGFCRIPKEYEEDLSLIRKQLVQIENQQSNLLDLLQKFIGSSENGMRSLETRVHGLELALDEISFDLAMSAGRMSKIDSEVTTCCKLPGTEFLSPKFWRRRVAQHSSRLLTSAGTPPKTAMRSIARRNGDVETFEIFKLDGRRFQAQGGGGFIVNPLAAVPSDSQGNSEVASNRVSKGIHHI